MSNLKEALAQDFIFLHGDKKYSKERRRIYRKSFADTVREFRDAYRKANKK